MAEQPPYSINLSPLHHHLRHAGRFSKIILDDLGIENGKLRMENYKEHAEPHGFQFSIIHSQFSIHFKPIAVSAAARYCGAATTYSRL